MAPQADQDPYASIATPVQDQDDPYAAIATPVQAAVAPSDANQDWRDRVMNRISGADMTPDAENTAKGQLERFGQSAAKTMAGTVLHPIDSARAVLAPTTDTPAALQSDLDTVKDAVHHPAEALGSVAGGMALGGVLGAGATAGDAAATGASRFRPRPSPQIVSPAEMAARKLTNAIGPTENRAPAMIKAASVETPNVLDYAARTNNPLNTRLEFVKAAEGNAEEARGHYEDNILGPNANHKVPAPRGSEVQSIPGGESPQNRVTTLGNIDKRVIDINKELDNPKLNASDTRRATDTELMAEKSQLLDILHKSLSDLTGIAPEEIGDLRARVGRSRELANDTNAAVTKQGLQEGKPAAMGGLPTGLGDVAVRAANAARGGPTAISDRAFQDAIKDFPGQAKPLPKISGPKQQTPTAASRFYRPPGPPPTEIPTVNTADPAAQQATRAANVSRFQNNQAAQQAAADAERQAVLSQQEREAANRATAGKRLQILAQQKGQAPPEPEIPTTIQPEKKTFDGQTSVAASVPSEVNDLLDRTGAKITNNEAPNSKVVASVDPDEPNNINIDDKERFSKDKNAAAQTLSHEAVHVWHNNLPPEIQKMIPADDPKDPYHKNGYEPDELQNMRAQGLKLYNLPRERAATVIQKYSHLGGSNAPKEVRDVYEPWAKDMTTSPLSTVMPTSGNQQGINTDVRPPGSAPMPETQIFPEEKEKSEGNSEKPEGKTGPKHPSGDITGFDEETGLPIVKRKSATKEANPEPKEEKPEPKPAKAETPAPKAETPKDPEPKPESKPEPKEDVPAPKSPPKGEAEPEQKASEKSGAFKVGDKVTLPDGTGATVAYVPSKNSQLPTYRFKTEDGKTRELRTSQMGRVKPGEESADGKTPPPGHTVVTTHFRKLPNR